MTRLVGDLHELSRADTASLALQKTDIALPGLVRGVLAAMAPRMAARNLQVDPAGLGAAVPQVLGDAERLRQVFSNILENSLRYTDAGGTVRLSVWECGRICHRAPGRFGARRSDRAAGADFRAVFIAARSRATGRPAAAGLGWRFANRSLRRMAARSRRAACDLGGLRIDIALPVDKGAARVTLIAIIEDETAIADILGARIWEREGFAIQRLASGTEAERWLRHGKPDLVLLDLMLPGIDGLTLCRRIREQAQIPVIMVTARGGGNRPPAGA